MNFFKFIIAASLLTGCAHTQNSNDGSATKENLEMKKSGYSSYEKIGDCVPREEVGWSDMMCQIQNSNDQTDCWKRQMEADQAICKMAPTRRAERAQYAAKVEAEEAARKAKIAQMPLCSNVTKVRVGMTKRQVAKLLGEPVYSKMQGCGGANGIESWNCEELTYSCQSGDQTSYSSNISVWYSGNNANHWE